jgi:hypothetical protein
LARLRQSETNLELDDVSEKPISDALVLFGATGALAPTPDIPHAAMLAGGRWHNPRPPQR